MFILIKNNLTQIIATIFYGRVKKELKFSNLTTVLTKFMDPLATG